MRKRVTYRDAHPILWSKLQAVKQGVYNKEKPKQIFWGFSLYCGLCRVNLHISIFNLPLSWLAVKVVNLKMVLYCLLVLLDVHTLLKKIFLLADSFTTYYLLWHVYCLFWYTDWKGITVFVQLYNMEKIFSFFSKKKKFKNSPLYRVLVQNKVQWSTLIQYVYNSCTAYVP